MDPKAEVVANAIVSEEIPVNVNNQTENQKKAAALREKVNQGSWREALSLAKEPPVNDEKASKMLESFGLTRDKDGLKDLSPEEITRKNEAETALKLNKKFTEQGYDSLTLTEKQNLQSKVLREARLRPALAGFILAMNAQQQKEFTERLLRDPEFMDFSRGTLEQILSQELDEQLMKDKKYRLEEAHVELNTAIDDVKDVNLRLKTLENRSKEFDRSSTVLGTKAQRIEAIKKTLPTIRQEINTAMSDKEALEKKLRRFEEERIAQLKNAKGRALSDIEQDITTTEHDIKTKKGEIDKKNAEIIELGELETEEKTLLAQEVELKNEKREKLLTRTKAENVWRQRNGEYDDSKRLREQQEKDLVIDLQNLIGEAANQRFNKDVERLSEEYDKISEEEKNKAKTEADKQFWDIMPKRWMQRKIRNRRGKTDTILQVDRERVNSDFYTLMNSGPDTIGEQMLRASINPDTGANYTEAEAQSFMAKEGWQLMQEEMVEQLLAHRLDTGGLSQEDIRVISTTKWGQGMVDKALENNDSFRSAVEKVYGKDALNRHTFWERWADKRESHSFIFYLLLGMIPPLVFTAISAAKEDPLKESIAA